MSLCHVCIVLKSNTRYRVIRGHWRKRLNKHSKGGSKRLPDFNVTSGTIYRPSFHMLHFQRTEIVSTYGTKSTYRTICQQMEAIIKMTCRQALSRGRELRATKKNVERVFRVHTRITGFCWSFYFGSAGLYNQKTHLGTVVCRKNPSSKPWSTMAGTHWVACRNCAAAPSPLR